MKQLHEHSYNMYKIITLEEGDPHVADMKNCNNNVADMKNCKTVKTVLLQRPLGLKNDVDPQDLLSNYYWLCQNSSSDLPR